MIEYVSMVSKIMTLLDAGADTGARTDKGITPLHVAAGNNDNPLVVKALLDAGLALI